jgi:hypothetical protein
MWIDVSEENIYFIFKVENQPSKKPASRRCLVRILPASWFHVRPIFYPENGDYTFLRNVGLRMDCTFLCFRRWQRLNLPLWEHQHPSLGHVFVSNLTFSFNLKLRSYFRVTGNANTPLAFVPSAAIVNKWSLAHLFWEGSVMWITIFELHTT